MEGLRARLQELKELLGDGYPVLIEAFCKDAEQRQAAIQASLDAGDFDEIKRAAHTLKGASRNIGAEELAEACQQIEHAALALDRDRVLQCLHGAQTVYVKLKTSLVDMRLA